MTNEIPGICPISGETPAEERINYLTHLAGLILSVIGVAVLVTFAVILGNGWCIASCTVYGTTLILLYAASTFYHKSQSLKQKHLLRIADHACIYLLIAGCFTPFTLGPLRDGSGWTYFWIEWGIAGVGVVFKFFAVDRFKYMSTFAYLLMGWLVVFTFPAMSETLSWSIMFWVVLGGLSYSFGTIFFLRESLPYNHGIWHLFVLGGGACHYCSIFSMVLLDPGLWELAS